MPKYIVSQLVQSALTTVVESKSLNLAESRIGYCGLWRR